jgi:hypothetical protein
MKLKKVLIGVLWFSLMIALGSTSAIATPADGTVVGTTKIVDNGPASDRFNLVLIAEGYQDTEQGQFAADAQAFINFLFATPPFSTNCSAFNVWRIDVESDDSGADDPTACSGGTGAEVDTYFDASFCNGDIRRLLVANSTTAIDVLDDEVPEWDQGLIIVNSNIYGGSGGSVAVTSVSGSWQNIAIHEFGHAAFGLADEYEYWAGCGADTDRDNHPAVEPAEPNVTIETDRDLVKWSDLILDTTPVPTTENADCTQCDSQANPYPGQTVVGLYEGAHYYHCDSFRPAFNCMMRNFAPFCPVCTGVILEVLEPFQPPNTAPTCDANGPYIAECTGATTTVMLDGSGSSDVDCDPLTFAWSGEFEGGTATGVMPSVVFSNLGVFTVELEVRDETDSATCSAEATIMDTTAPSIDCPLNVTVECDQPTDPLSTGMATATDACDSDPVTTFSDVVTPGACQEEETITRTWAATDASGNSTSCVQTIEVVDTTPPVIDPNAPDTITPPDAPISFTATATDNCDGDPSVEITEYDCYFFTKKDKRIDKTESCVVEISGDTITILDSGGVDDQIEWTISAEDNCGNAAGATHTVSVVKPGKP